VSPGGAVLFEDDFTGPAGVYDHSKWGEWSTATYNSSAAYGSIQPGDRSTLDGQGHLSIPATPAQGTSISTKDDFTFTYGTITARIMVQPQTGYWPSFWILNSPPSGADAALVGEVDILEAYTQYNDGYLAGAHNYVNGVDEGPTGGGWYGTRTDIRGVWHDYGARIEPDKVTFLFDGVEFFSFGPDHPSLAGKPWAWGPGTQNWLLLTNAVGNSSQGMSPPTADSVLLVDRVEVRAL
jgi:beta-glucanase (GH16 family)